MNLLQYAETTQDAEVSYISPHISDHALDVQAHEVQLLVPLMPAQEELAAQVLQGQGNIEGLVRSSIAQLGIDLEVDTVTIRSSKLVLNGRLLIMPGSAGERVLQRIIVLNQQTSILIGRAVMLPYNAKLTTHEVEQELTAESIVAEEAKVDEQGALLLPLTNQQHVFVQGAPSESVLDHILQGTQSGRSLIAGMRTISSRNQFLGSRDFLVGGINLTSKRCHIMLQPWAIEPSGETSHAMHLSAYLLDAGRTQGGHRHVELWNTNGAPVDLDTVRIAAYAYRTRNIQSPGI